MSFTYRAIRLRQSTSERRIVLFNAKAPDIEQWAGVPQKKRFGESSESTGFQREQNAVRVRNLEAFYSQPDNIIQNPLLCALRDAPPSIVEFQADASQNDPNTETGTLTIDLTLFADMSLEDVFRSVRESLQKRVQELASRVPSERKLAEIRARAKESGIIPPAEIDGDLGIEGSGGEQQEEGASAESVIFEESHIFEFWEEVAVRHIVLEELRKSGAPFSGDALLGFDRAAMISYLKPVVLVDGQHRLAGALKAAERELDEPSAQQVIEREISAGRSSQDVSSRLLLERSRCLPVSLLMTTSPEEQVFQFIIVNQKATPIGKSLLGTIVSTSLANEELGRVAGRLRSAGIRLEESQAITMLSRLQESPFRNLVERGLTGDAKDLLQWSVFGGLIAIFRDLTGGTLFGQKNDYADRWRKKYLDSSPIAAEFQKHGYGSAFEYWRSLDGPWRPVFIQFWTKIRDTFGDTSDRDRFNYWGRPRDSNLFNKISLTILAADFFQYLVDTKTELKAADDVPGLVDDWLEDVNRGYFNKDWNLGGVKKDSVGIRNQWAALWTEYRKSPTSLPNRNNFRSPKIS